MSEESKPKPKRERKKTETPKGVLNKQELVIVAGRVQTKVNNIAKNHQKGLGTAQRRLGTKYSKLVDEELLGLDTRVLELVELPIFYVKPEERDAEQVTDDQLVAE